MRIFSFSQNIFLKLLVFDICIVLYRVLYVIIFVEVYYMSFFLKITHKPKGDYLQIYDSSHVRGKKYNLSKCVRSLGYLQDLISTSIPDPITYYRQYCNNLNLQTKQNKKLSLSLDVSDENLEFYLGNSLVELLFNSFLFPNLLSVRSLAYEKKLPYLTILKDLISARLISPASKYKTYTDIIPKLYGKRDYSLDDIYDALDDLGNDYQGVIELFDVALKKAYKFDTTNTFFDCTNFYFEIDREDDLRRKGPSKENRKDPIMGLGLLLDKNCVPISMMMYPGNQSEKPIQRELVKQLKDKEQIEGRTVIVADKGLNCARNIFDAIHNNLGYIYSKSINSLSEKEKVWVLLDNRDYPESAYTHSSDESFKIKSCVDSFSYSFKEGDKTITFSVKEKRVVYFNNDLYEKKKYELEKMHAKLNDLILSKAKREEYGPYASYVEIKAKDNTSLSVKINEDKFKEDLKYAGYNMIVTSEIKESEKSIYETYHHLWRIEETFRIMKTDLDARPVYLQKQNRIYGHFLVCYLAVCILRIYQFLLLKEEYKANEILEFIRRFKVIKYQDMNINISKIE